MDAVILRPAKVFELAVSGVQSGHLGLGFPGPLNTEHIVGGGNHQGGLRSADFQKVGVIESERNLVEEILLGVLRTDGLQQAREIGDVRLGGRRQNSLVEGRDVGRLRAAARAARDAEAIAVHFGPGEEVVHRPDAVPNHVVGQRVARNERLRARIKMLPSSRAYRGTFRFRIVIIEPLTLPDRIESQHDEAFFDQIQNHALVHG